MLDIKLIRENVEEVIRRLNTRGGDFSYLRDLKAKDEKIRTDNITTLKGMMAAFNVDFDSAFAASGFDISLKEEYRRLVEEKTLSR